jgi:hypothetical protein
MAPADAVVQAHPDLPPLLWTVCMNCVAQGGPFVVGALVYLKVMGGRASRRRRMTESVPAESAEAEQMNPVESFDAPDQG